MSQHKKQVGLLSKLMIKQPKIYKQCPRIKLGYKCHTTSQLHGYQCTDCGRGVV